MKKFLIVLKYELKEYISNKAFMVFTILLAIAGAVILFLPRVINMSDFTGVHNGAEESKEQKDASSKEAQEKEIMMLMDNTGIVDVQVLAEFFPDAEWQIAQNEQAITEAIENQTAKAGFMVQSLQEYEYYVYNKSLHDSSNAKFEQAIKIMNRMNYCIQMGLNYEEMSVAYDTPITIKEQVLHKDTGSNYWYCYMLVIIVFMLIVMYGQMIAVSVTNEKSNRAIEILVTSTTPNSLLFGKVIAGAIGGLFQTGLVLGAILLSYQINREQWGGRLDMIFHVPAEVLVTFAFFGIGGYLFYAFLYGAMGALVSKTEDVSKSAGGLMVLTMGVYFFSLFQLTNVDGVVIKILSFLPISSYSTMFARIAMGNVQVWEIVLSFVILVVSIIGAGMLGAKLYRMGTLRYGNPIKLSSALKDIRKSE